MDKIRVFLTDGYSCVRRGIALIIQGEEDMEVIGEADDEWQTLESIQGLRPDVVVMRVETPEQSDIDATRRIVETLPEASVLILSGQDRQGFLVESLRAGAAGFVSKQASVEILLKAIQTLYTGGTFIYPRISISMAFEFDIQKRLSPRQREVLPMLVEGRTCGEIGEILHISPYTAQAHRQRIMKKLGIHNQANLLKYALRRGLIKQGV